MSRSHTHDMMARRFSRLAAGTRKEYLSTLRKWTDWGGGVPVERLTRREIRDFLDWVHERAATSLKNAVLRYFRTGTPITRWCIMHWPPGLQPSANAMDRKTVTEFSFAYISTRRAARLAYGDFSPLTRTCPGFPHHFAGSASSSVRRHPLVRLPCVSCSHTCAR